MRYVADKTQLNVQIKDEVTVFQNILQPSKENYPNISSKLGFSESDSENYLILDEIKGGREE